VGSAEIIMSEIAETQGSIPAAAMTPNAGVVASGVSAKAFATRSVSADSFRRLTSLLKKPTNVPDLSPAIQTVAPTAPVVAMVAVPAPIIVQAVAASVDLVPELVFQSPPVLEVEITQPVEPEAPAPAPEQPKPLPRPKLRDAFAQSPTIVPAKPAGVVIPQTPEQELESAELARSLLDMMASSNSTGLPQERALAADTLLRMLSKLPLKSLIMLSERLCMMDNPPQLIVAKLIGDPRIEISGPLLENCMHISDEVLISVINEGLPDKRRMMARRRKISRAVSAQLVHTEDPSVLLTLVRNVNAEIAHESFIDLVQLSGEHTELLAPLCIRQDLPVPFAFELFWLAPAQLRRYLLSRFLTDSETLTKILKIALDGNGDENAEKTFPDPERIKSALQLAAEGKQDEAAAVLAECAKIDVLTAERILSDKQGDPLAAYLKATGVPRSVAEEILNQAVTTILDCTRDPEELQSMFASLSFNKARILLTYWDWATLQSGPYAPLN
jgi:uncharacterized protein (DUF2336 family)